MPSQPDSNALFITVFDTFVQSYIDHSTKDNMGLVTYFDKDWDSPCFQTQDLKDIDEGQKLEWRPFLRAEKASLHNLEEALEISIPTELQQLFCRYYSHDLNAQADYGNLTLLQVWNEDDFDRLQKNLIAHVLMKRRLKQADTLFFALTDEEDYILSIALKTGAVMLEKVGKEPHREIAPNLADFIAQLKPLPELVTL
jgi:SecY interacting protein Syd